MGSYKTESFTIGKEGVYESKDQNEIWWPVTLVSRTGEKTYSAEVKDGTGKLWPVVFAENIRIARPRTPLVPADIQWDPDEPLLVLNASNERITTFRAGTDGKGFRIGDNDAVYTEATKKTPEYARVYMLFTGPDALKFKMTMPIPQHATYPLLRRLFNKLGVKHNLGPELPDCVEEWVRHESSKGLLYWHNTKTKQNTWNEPPVEVTELAFERQLQQAMQVSMEGGVPRSPEETAAEQRRLQDKLAKAGRVEIEVAKDGHCQFSSVAYFVKADQHKFQECRKELVDYIRGNRETYFPFMDDDFDAYCEEMENTSRWGDHITLAAAANLYKLKIQVISSSDSAIKSIMPRDPEGELVEPEKTVTLSYFAEPKAMHYNPVISKTKKVAATM